MAKWRALAVMNTALALLFLVLTPTKSALSGSTCSDSVTVIQYNLAFENTNLEQFVEYIETTRPDLVVMQEVSPQHGQFFDRLFKLFPYRYGGQAKIGYPSNQLILSRQTLYGMSVYRTPDGQNIISGVWQPRQGIDVGILAAHPPSPRNKTLWYRRDALIRTVEHLAASSATPRNMVIGDFNLSASNHAYKARFSEYTSMPVASWKGVRSEIELPAMAMASIDHLWVKSDTAEQITLCSREALLEIFGSDHVPIKTTISF
ncbi:endonuclease/exonuclease/phosphatase family protein [Vibrio superstes]|nr:endonuclease/exonuclease/phosphatase family protein [Vibrio superstes]